MDITTVLRAHGIGVGKKLVGDAQPSDVLAGRTFSNADGNDKVGTMPNRGAVTITPGTTDQTIAEGYHNGLGKVVGDPDLVSGNIRAGVNIFGVSGKASVVDTADANAEASDMKSGKTAYVNGNKVTGNMPVHGAGDVPSTGVTVTGGKVKVNVPIDAFYSSTTLLTIDEPDLVSSNVKSGVNILGVQGNFTADANAAASDILSGKSAYVNGQKVNGSMVDRTGDGNGYYNLSANVLGPGPGRLYASLHGPGAYRLNASGYSTPNIYIDDPDFIAANIKNGVSIFGLVGTFINDPANALRYATGTTTSASTSPYLVTVRGLAFRPRIIIVKDRTVSNKDSSTSVYCEAGFLSQNNGYPASFYIGSTVGEPIAITPSIYDDGFDIQYWAPNDSVGWIALG